MHVALQPSGNPASRKHYQDTIERPVPQAMLAQFLSESQMRHIGDIYGHTHVPTWGVTPGVNDVNHGKWDRLTPGDCVLFAAKHRVHASATVTMKAQSRDLAKSLWGNHENGQTWEYIYFLADIAGHNIDIEELRKTAGYKPGFRVQGFNVLDDEKSERIRTAFALDASRTFDSDDDSDHGDLEVEGDLDVEATTTQRREQGRLKRILLGARPTGDCAMCGRSVPAPLLIAAHIKKRARCSDQERRDLRNVAVLMCRMGCDDLYEKGYFSVRDGVVQVSPLLVRTPAVDALVAIVKDRPVRPYGPQNAAYFAWHWDNVFKAQPAAI